MKKTILTLSFIALFTVVSKAQDTKTKVKEGERTEAVSPGAAAKTEAKQEEPAKKSGTRMAINQKGLPGGSSKTEKKEAVKEEKTATPGQPGTSSKK